MSHKDKLIEYQRRLSQMKKRLQIEIKNDASNYVELQNTRVSLFTECRDLIMQMVVTRESVLNEYYKYLKEHAGEYNEKELPLYIKGDAKYQNLKRKKVFIELMIEDVYATQRFIETRSYDLKGALDSAKMVRQITTGN